MTRARMENPVTQHAELRSIKIGGDSTVYTLNLADIGFSGTVSQQARDEIRRLDERASKVLSTSDRFAFR